MDIGAKGLMEVNLIIPQDTDLPFIIYHKDKEGNVIDHSSDTANMAFQSKDGSLFVDLDDCVELGADKITVSIPASVSKGLPIGKLNWDLFVTSSSRTRMCYGTVTVVDTYARDDER